MTQETYKVYTRVLKFGLKLGLKRLIETIAFGITIFSITLIYFYFIMSSELSPIGKYIFFPLGVFTEIVLILSYLENHYQINVFGENANKLFSGISIIALSIIILYSTIPGLYEIKEVLYGNVSLIVLFFLLTTIETGYFIFSIPRANLSEMTFGLEHQFKTLEKNLQNKKLKELPLEKAITKGIEALKIRITEDCLWGEIDSLYETAIVLDLFHSFGYKEDMEWIIPTAEGKKPIQLMKVIDTLKKIIETSETLELSYEQYKIIHSLSLYDTSILFPYKQQIDNFYDTITEETEWDFITKLNRFTAYLRSKTTPLHLIMCYVGDEIGNIRLLDKLANMFASSIEIVIKRGYARFSTSQTGKTPIEMFSRLMLALYDIRRPPIKRMQFAQAVSGQQFIEGSWAGNIGTTGYVIKALIPGENPDSIVLKKAALYLTAVQDKQGLWGANIEETVIALNALKSLKDLAEQEVE